MPEVGYSKEPVRVELKTVPDGYVLLRRLPYDEMLQRREMGMRLGMKQEARRGGRRNRNEAQDISIELAQIATREFEFKACIVEHNLTVDGTPVDFNQPKLAFKVVDPTVLQEIEMHLSELNMETDEEELEDFLKRAKRSSSDERTPLQNTTEKT